MILNLFTLKFMRCNLGLHNSLKIADLSYAFILFLSFSFLWGEQGRENATSIEQKSFKMEAKIK